MASEYEATQVYMQLAESNNNKLAEKMLKSVVDEERIHMGEFLRLLQELAPDEEKFLVQGAKKSGRIDRGVESSEMKNKTGTSLTRDTHPLKKASEES